MSLSHGHLAALVQKGNQNAFAKLVSEYTTTVHGIIDSYDVDKNEREDIFQEGLLGLYKAALSYRADMHTSFPTFARICIKHSIISALRTYYSNKNYPLVSSCSIDNCTDDFEKLQNLDTDTDPEGLLIEQENLVALMGIINVTLSNLERKVLKMYVQGFPYKDIAERLDISVKSVGNAIQRIRGKLKLLVQP